MVRRNRKTSRRPFVTGGKGNVSKRKDVDIEDTDRINYMGLIYAMEHEFLVHSRGKFRGEMEGLKKQSCFPVRNVRSKYRTI